MRGQRERVERWSESRMADGQTAVGLGDFRPSPSGKKRRRADRSCAAFI